MARRCEHGANLPVRRTQLIVPGRNGVHDPNEIERIGRMLLGDSQSATAATYGPAFPREPVLFASQSVLNWHLPRQLSTKVGLSQAFAANGRLYLRGAVLGAGVSTLASAAVRAYNQRNERLASPQRAQIVSFRGDSRSSENKFLTAFLAQLGLPEQRAGSRRGTDALLLGVVAALTSRHIQVLVIDDVDHLSSPVLSVLESLIELLDPKTRAQRDATDTWLDINYMPAIIMVGHRVPRLLFVRHKKLAGAIEGRIATLRLYDTLDEMAEAINSARIWKRDITLRNPDHRRMCELVLQGTGGLPTNMQPVLEEMELLVRINDAAPSGELITAVFEDRTFLLMVRRTAGNVPGTFEYTTRVDDRLEEDDGANEPLDEETQGAEAGTYSTRESSQTMQTRTERIAAKKQDRARAQREHRKMKRKKPTLVRPSAQGAREGAA